MKRRRYSLVFNIAAVVITAAAVGSCIKNNVPEADITGVFLEFEAEGQKRVSINTLTRTIDIDMDETVDMKNVKMSKVTLVEGGTCQIATGSVVDFSSPVKVKVITLAEYEWTITATQTIDRRFVIENQVGAAHFEEHSRSAFAYVPVGTDLTKINVMELKLGPAGQTTMTPELVGEVSFRASAVGDETKVREVRVKYRDVDEIWNVYVTETETQLNKADVFARRVYLSGYGQQGYDNGFEYRPAAGYEPPAGGEEGEPDNNWVRVPEHMMTYDEGVFEAVLTGLEPETEYVARAFSGESYSDQVRFTTEGTRDLPDGSFENWYFGMREDVTGRETTGWNPWLENGERWWDTGNPGATTLGNSNSVPTEYGEGCPLNPSGRAAYLETKFVGLATVGKVAGGNLFFGQYHRTSGTNGLVDIGRPWQHKPTKLTGWYKYFPKPITDVGTLHSDLKEHYKGSTDSLFISVALWASPDGRTIPFTENTIPADFKALTRNTSGVIAYGALATPREQAAWAEFSIDIEYFDTGELPANTVLYISCTSSKGANYFTAGRGSLLYLDEMNFVYD